MKEKTFGHCRVLVELGDITKLKVDAIVNAANSALAGGGGVDGAIHRAGGPSILRECQDIVAARGRLAPGQAVITTGGRLPAAFVIHTVGPIWHGGGQKEALVLASAYRESLALAVKMNLHTLAFPAISTGVYGYPADEAARVAVTAVKEFLETQEHELETVLLVIYSPDMFQVYDAAVAAA